MSGGLLLEPVLRAIDANGLAMSGALLQFYLTGGTTPTNTYTSSTLGTPNANPVVADSGGLFTPIYLDPAITYRIQLKTSGGSLIRDIDPFTIAPIIANLGITAAMLAVGAAVSNIGYTPVNKAGDTATDLRLAFGATLHDDNPGYLGMPRNTHDADYTFALTDAGHLNRHTDGSARAWTIPPVSSVAWTIGTVLPCRNIGSGVVTLTRGAGVTQRLAGSATDKNVALAQYAMGAITMEDTDIWVFSGTGGS